MSPRPNTRPANIQFFEWFPPGLRFLRSRSQIAWQCGRLATPTPVGVTRTRPSRHILLWSALRDDGLWVLANRILADRSFADRRRRRRRLLARQIGGNGSAQHGQQSHSAQYGDEPSRAHHSKERSRHQCYDLHHAIPFCRSPRTSDRGRPYLPPAVEWFLPLHIFDPSQSTTSRATKFLTKG